MSDKPNADNPYAPPAADADWLVMRRRTFQIGVEEIHTIQVETSLWTGLKTRSVDAAGNATANHRGPCRFQVGQRELHEVEIELDAALRINVNVDGKLVEGDLFPRTCATVLVTVTIFVLVTVMALTIAGIVASKMP